MAPSVREVGPFRPLRPFSEVDRALFFGREREATELVDRLSGEPASVLLFGEAGIGKTSLVRAALLPLLKSRGVACAYVDANQLGDPQLPAGSANGALLVIDDLGAALDEGAHFEKLISVLRAASAVRGLKILFVVEDSDLWRLDPLEKMVGRIGPAGSRLHLGRLDEGRTADVIERTVLGGGAYFEAGLSQQMAADLARSGPVSPSAIQVVAGTAVSLRFNTSRAYRGAGGAEVIGWRFFEQACQSAGGRPAVRVLGEIAGLEERGVATIDGIARAAGLDESRAIEIASGLEAEHLVRRAAGGYVLASEWVRDSARAYTGEARGRAVSSRLVLRQKAGSGGLLSPVQLGEVRRFAGRLGPAEEQVMRRSLRVGLAIAGLLIAIPLIALFASYRDSSRREFFDVMGQAPGSSVVVRLGKPAMKIRLPHVPAFGAVIADTGFTRAALDGRVPDGTVMRDTDWLLYLERALRPLPRGVVALILEGDVHPLTEAYADASLRPAVVDALGAAGAATPDELALLQRALSDPSEGVRRRAVEAAFALERRAPGAAGALLVQAVKDPSATIRASAIAAIIGLPDAEAGPMLVQTIAQSPDPVVRHDALQAVNARVLHAPALAAALVSALSGPASSEVAALLTRLLEGTGAAASAAEQSLAKCALDGKVAEETRIEALRLLRHRPATPASIRGITGSSRLMAAAIPLIARSAKPEDAATQVAQAMNGPAVMRASAAATLGLLARTPDTEKQLKRLLADGSSEVRVEAIRSLPVLGREALSLLEKAAKNGGAQIEKAAVETIGANAAKLGPSQSAQALEVAVKGARPAVREAAIEALGQIAQTRPAAAANTLGRMLKDPSAEIRGDAAQALGDVLEYGGKESLSALRLAGRDPDPSVRRRAAAALGRARPALANSAARILITYAGDVDSTVRAAAAGALGGLGGDAHDNVTRALVSLLRDKDPAVRAAARMAARQLGVTVPELDRVLLASFASAGAPERSDIATTAGYVGATQTLRAALADADGAVRRAAAEHAGRLGGTLPGLVSALGDPDPAVRVAAIRGLVGARAVAALLQAGRSSDVEVRCAALKALGEVGGPEAQKLLVSALQDASEQVRVAAVNGLEKAGSHAGKPLERQPLERALRDPARDVREGAVAALGVVWARRPAAELAVELRDEASGDRRYAAAIALARKAEGPKGTNARHILDEVASEGPPATRLSARLGRAFVGRADAMVPFLRVLRNGL